MNAINYLLKIIALHYIMEKSSLSSMDNPKIYNINTPLLPPPLKYVLFGCIPVYFFSHSNTGVMSIDFVFDIGTDGLQSKLNLGPYFTNSFLTAGTYSFNEMEISNLIDSSGSFLSLNHNRQYSTVSLHTISNSCSSIIPVVLDLIINPVYPSHIIDNRLQNKKKLFSIASTRVTEKAKMKFKEILYGINHPYGRPICLKDFESVSSKDLKGLHNSIYRIQSSNKQLDKLNIIISGDYTGDIRSLLGKELSKVLNLSSHDSGMEELFYKDTHRICSNFSNKPSNFYINKKNALQTAFRIGRFLPGPNHEDFFGLKILVTILGGYFGSRLMTNIREEKGYTYGIGAFIITDRFYSELNIVTEVGFKYTKNVLKEIIKEINFLKEKKIGFSELNKVKSYLLGSILHNCNGPFNQAAVFRDFKKHDSTFTFIEDFISVINDIDGEKIQCLAQTYFNIQDFSFVACGPPKEKLW